MRYLVAYDIADPRRLRRVARFMEKHAIRIQKSVFICDAGRSRMLDLLRQLSSVIDNDEDIIQAFRLVVSQPKDGLLCGTVTPVQPPFVICDGETHAESNEEDWE